MASGPPITCPNNLFSGILLRSRPSLNARNEATKPQKKHRKLRISPVSTP
jgi:hypothetical protein